MNDNSRRDLTHDLILPTVLFAALGAMTWAVRGCSGYGAVNGCVFAGVTWGAAWWFIARDPSGAQSRRYASGWIVLALAVGIGLSGSRGWMQWPSFFRGELMTNAPAGKFVPISRVYGFVWLFIAGVAWAGWTKIDDFQSYTTDSNIDGQGYWLVYEGGYPASDWRVATDPASASNNVLRGLCSEGYAGGGVIAFNTDPTLSMPQGTTPATYFYRMRIDQASYEIDWAAGMSHLASPTGWSSFKTGVMGEGPFAPGLFDPNYEVRVNNGPGPGGVPPSTGWKRECDVVTDQWYDVWVVVHNLDNNIDPNNNDTFDLYIQGGAFTTQTQLANNVHYFRSAAENGPLLSFMAVVDSNQVVYIDDLYVDTSGQNLEPVPEPVTLALLGLGGAVLAVWRRRRRA